MTPDNPPSAPSAISPELIAKMKEAYRDAVIWGRVGAMDEVGFERAMDQGLLAAVNVYLSSRPSPTVERREKIAREIGQMIIAQLMLYDESGETSPSTDAEVEHLSEMIVREFLAQPATGGAVTS